MDIIKELKADIQKQRLAEEVVKIGDRVKVTDGSGIDSKREGVVIDATLPLNRKYVKAGYEGRYKEFDPKKESLVQDDGGKVFSMFTSRLKKIPAKAALKEAEIAGFKVLKSINSHAGYYRFRSEMDDEPIGYITRVKGIPSPYSSSPTDIVYRWNDKDVICRETRHKYYQVFEVPKGTKIYKTDDEATDAHIKSLKESTDKDKVKPFHNVLRQAGYKLASSRQNVDTFNHPTKPKVGVLHGEKIGVSALSMGKKFDTPDELKTHLSSH